MKPMMIDHILRVAHVAYLPVIRSVQDIMTTLVAISMETIGSRDMESNLSFLSIVLSDFGSHCRCGLGIECSDRPADG